MYDIAIVFALLTINDAGLTLETHGKFADAKACEAAASVVEQSFHPIPQGHRIICMRRAEVNVVAYTSKENT